MGYTNRVQLRMAPLVGLLVVAILAPASGTAARAEEDITAGGRWVCHVIDRDPHDHGPDGATVRDFDGDGLPDLLVPFEQGGYSRIYWHPGYASATDGAAWTFTEFAGGAKSPEDAGAGDLDGDGFVDLVIDGGWVYFNPGPELARDAAQWQPMMLFDQEGRVPIVLDVDEDGNADLLVAGSILYRGPASDKRTAANWRRYEIGKTTWAMNAIPHDMDRDGDLDLVIADRNGAGTIWLERPEGDPFRPWKQHVVDDFNHLSFMKVADVDGDGRDDLVTTTKREIEGKTQPLVEIYRRTNDRGMPTFDRMRIRPPCGDFPKGVNVSDYDGDGRNDLFVLSKGRGEWIATYATDPTDEDDWNAHARPLEANGWESRKKMDDAVHVDLDGDGDTDVVTTEENSGWGVIWFANPRY